MACIIMYGVSKQNSVATNRFSPLQFVAILKEYPNFTKCPR